MFDIFSKTSGEIQEFNTKSIAIVESTDSNGIRRLNKNAGGYNHSQKRVLEDIDLITASKFRTGEVDEEGQQKIFLNTADFIVDVARKNIDIDVKNFVFRPEDKDYRALATVMSKDFHIWAKKKEYGEKINQFVDDFPKYGTVVSKKVKGDIVRVPLRNLINSQEAESLEKAVEGDGYVIETHNLSYYEVQKFPEWKCDEFTGKHMFFERYGLVPKNYLDKCNGKESDDKTLVKAVFIVCLETSEILFCEQVDELPYEEAHWEKIDGRWLGRGEVEKQFENQKAMNFAVNLQKRGMLWSTKKVFQTQNASGQKSNLVKQVRDGEILEVGINGNITPVNMQTQAGGDYSQFMQIWGDNGRNKSFTFESATGESMPSGTPFRLGAMLTQATQLHYDRKREKLGLFLQCVFYEQIVPIFKKENKKHTIFMSSTETGFNLVRDVVTSHYKNKFYTDALKGGDLFALPTYEEVQKSIDEQVGFSEGLFLEIMDDAYSNVYSILELDITGESRNTESEMVSLSSLYQVLSQKGDPRADMILEEMISLTGRSLPTAPKQTTNPIQQDKGQAPDVSALMKQYAGGSETSVQ